MVEITDRCAEVADILSALKKRSISEAPAAGRFSVPLPPSDHQREAVKAATSGSVSSGLVRAAASRRELRLKGRHGLGLHVRCRGRQARYADYIFPDCTSLERWEFAGTHFSIPWKVQPIWQPVIAPLTGTVRVFGEEVPLTLEAMLLAVAQKLGLPGFGRDAFGPGQHFLRLEDSGRASPASRSGTATGPTGARTW